MPQHFFGGCHGRVDRGRRHSLGRLKALTDLHALRGTTGRIADVAFGDVSGWLCCVRWTDDSYSWIAADDNGTSVEIER